MIVAATGHRPDKLGSYGTQPRLALGGLATEYLRRVEPTEVIVGMAQGWDQAVAGACVSLRVPFTAAVPFDGQERRWPDEAQRRYWRLLGHAENVVTVTEGEVVGDRAVNAAMQRRNEWMVDRCARVAALWDGSWGGTFNCVRYAESIGRPIDHLWPRWSLPADVWEML